MSAIFAPDLCVCVYFLQMTWRESGECALLFEMV